MDKTKVVKPKKESLSLIVLMICFKNWMTLKEINQKLYGKKSKNSNDKIEKIVGKLYKNHLLEKSLYTNNRPRKGYRSGKIPFKEIKPLFPKLTPSLKKTIIKLFNNELFIKKYFFQEKLDLIITEPLRKEYLTMNNKQIAIKFLKAITDLYFNLGIDNKDLQKINISEFDLLTLKAYLERFSSFDFNPLIFEKFYNLGPID
jgi:hypothetical protein